MSPSPPYQVGGSGERVTVYEVGPRDGLQNLSQTVPVQGKIDFIVGLLDAGLPAVEVTSFVRPDWVPQLGDAQEVFQEIARSYDPSQFRLPVLVPNERGLARALECGAKEIAVFAAATESFSRKNTNASILETMVRFRPVVETSRQENLRVRGYVSVCFGCPYEGEVDPEAVLRVVSDLLDLGCDEISVGDTIGVAHPGQVGSLVRRLVERFDVSRLAMHFHDTRGTALANTLEALSLGVRTFDASAGGLGGCPYAPGAAGNLATEDLLYLLEGLGYETGTEIAKVASAGHRLADALGIELPGRVSRALLACDPD